ncbi:MAG TPA: VWA domain-containing protein [Blastocatellia bacterium]|nr:VWA domain-containing protein [Blastocatellia bacterium]
MKTSAPTLRLNRSHRFATTLLLTIAFLLSTNTIGAQGSSTRVESFALQPGGEVRIENSRGSTRIDAWEGHSVRVTAEKKGSPAGELEAGELVLMGMGNTVIIQCKRGASSARIDLTVYVPRGSRVEVTGGAWPVDVNGSLSGAIVETTSGSISYRLPSFDDASVAMQSVQGAVKSTLALADSERDGTHGLRGRIGEGLAEISLNSQTGNITLAPGANSMALARNANTARGVTKSPVQSSNGPKQSRVGDFDRPPLGSQQPANVNARDESQDDQASDADIASSTVPGQSNRRMPPDPNNSASGNGSVVFAGSDVADQSASNSKTGKFERSREAKRSSGGDAGMRVRIMPGAIPSVSGSVDGRPDDQDADAEATAQQSSQGQIGGNQTWPSNGSGSGRNTAVFAGSGVSNDDSSTSKLGPLDVERKKKVMKGGDSGLRVRIIPANQPLGATSSDSSIYPQSVDSDDSQMGDEPPTKTKSSRKKSGSQPSRTDDYDQSNGAQNSRSAHDPRNVQRDSSASNDPDDSDGIASSRARSAAPPVLKRESPELSSDETTDPRAATSGSAAGDAIVLKSALVNLNVSVTNRSGAAFGNLKKEDFRVAENGESQKVEFFAPTTAPFNLVLLLDLSGSIQDKLEIIKSAAVRFLDVIEPQDRVAVVTFTDQIRVVSELTANRSELKERILAIRRPQGGTAFYEALWFSLVETLRNSRGQRNAIVVMTDGVDSSLDRYNPAPTRVSFKQLAHRLEESDTLVFPIYLDTEYEEVFERGNSTSEAYAIGRDQLEKIADVSGARLFKAEKASDLSGVYKQVAAAIRTMYSVGYYPTNPEKDGTYRRVRVTVDRPDAAVRTRKGYYAK